MKLYSQADEETYLRNKITNDLAFIERAKFQIERYTHGIKRATKRIKKNRKTLKAKFADIEQLTPSNNQLK